MEREPELKNVLNQVVLMGAADQLALLRRTWESLLETGVPVQSLRRMLERPGSIEGGAAEPLLIVSACGVGRDGCMAPASNVPAGLGITYSKCPACELSVRADELERAKLFSFRRSPAPLPADTVPVQPLRAHDLPLDLRHAVSA